MFSATDSSGVQATIGTGPITAGTSALQIITVDTDSNRFFSYASMILPSSDYFVANESATAFDLTSLFNGSISQRTINIGLSGAVKDAGTEVNDFNTSPGNPLFGLAVGQTAPNQGATQSGNVTLVENAFANFLNTPVGFDLAAFNFNNTPFFQMELARLLSAQSTLYLFQRLCLCLLAHC